MKQKNKFTRYLLALSLLLPATMQAGAASQWQLKKNSNDIRIYTRSTEGSDIKEIKASFELKGSLDQVRSLLLDIASQQDWVYSTVQSRVIKQVGPGELIYYSEKEMPWPVTNRDVVMHVKLSNPQKNVLILKASSVHNMVPEKKGIVRVPSSEVSWKVTATGNNTLRVEYLAKADPGGSVPAWVTNIFLTKGPYETFMKFREKMERS